MGKTGLLICLSENIGSDLQDFFYFILYLLFFAVKFNRGLKVHMKGGFLNLNSRRSLYITKKNNTALNMSI